MINKVTSLVCSLLMLHLSVLPPAFANAEKYDKILLRMEKVKNFPENTNEEKSEKPKTWTLTFEHENLPKLDGTWIMKKKAFKRKGAYLTKYITQVPCLAKLPFEERPFEKEIIVSSQGQDYFVLRALYPQSKDSFLNTDKTNNSEYQTFNLKGVVIPPEITYSYTLKLVNHIESPTFARQLWFNGKLIVDKVSKNKITGKGYELEYTPECLGYVRDEIEFELVKI